MTGRLRAATGTSLAARALSSQAGLGAEGPGNSPCTKRTLANSVAGGGAAAAAAGFTGGIHLRLRLNRGQDRLLGFGRDRHRERDWRPLASVSNQPSGRPIRGQGTRRVEGAPVNHHWGWAWLGAIAGFHRLAPATTANPGRSGGAAALVQLRAINAAGAHQNRNGGEIINGKGGDLHHGRFPGHRLPAGGTHRHRDLLALPGIGAA